MYKRRDFLKNSVGLITLASYPACNTGIPKTKYKQPKKALAINMWDFTWLLRSHPNGGFENWEKVLDELFLRGYNALRIDCFPQFIANNDSGICPNEYQIPANNGRVLWGNKKAIKINPKESILKFLKLCQQRDIKIVLSSWFASHGTKRNTEFKGINGLVRAWDETLNFLDENSALDNIYYVDLLNEYPLWHGYEWLTKKLKEKSNYKNVKKTRWDFLNAKEERFYNEDQLTYYNHFIKSTINQLKKKWPSLLFTASQTNTLNVPWQDLDTSQFDILDIHLWIVYNKNFSSSTGYFNNIHTLGNEKELKNSFNLIQQYWSNNKEDLVDWLDRQVELRSEKAKTQNIPIGNTEGWGAVMWQEGKPFNWDFIKDAGLLGAKIGNKHGYTFNCSSNFNHPHFKTLWDDISWHQEVTKIIKS